MTISTFNQEPHLQESVQINSSLEAEVHEILDYSAKSDEMQWEKS